MSKKTLPFITIVCLVLLGAFGILGKSSLYASSESEGSKTERFKTSSVLLNEIFLGMQNSFEDEYETYLQNFPATEYDGKDLAFTSSVGEILIAETGGTAAFTVEAPADALYAVSFAYKPEGNNLLPTVLSVTVDGDVPFKDLSALQANNIWVSEGFPLDRYGNECVGMPIRENTWQLAYFRGVTGMYSEPMLLHLTKGSHEIVFSCDDGAVWLHEIYLGRKPDIPTDSSEAPNGNGFAVIEAEQMNRRNNPNIRTNALYSTELTPYSTTKRLQNVLDDNSFKFGAGLVEYDFEVPNDGYYNLMFDYRQGDKSEFTVFRNIYIDGVIPQKSFQNVPFNYSRSFTEYTLPTSVYLTAGKHTLGLEVSLDHTRVAVKIIEQVVNEMNSLTLEISRITGGNTDRFRDFRLSEYEIDAGEMLLYWAGILEDTYSALDLLKTGNGKCGEIEPLLVASKLLRILAKEPDELPKRLNEFSYGASSARQYLTTLAESLQFSQLGLDKMVFYQNKKNIPSEMGLFQSVAASVSRFFNSFGEQEYTPLYDGKTGETLQVWVNRSRQYLEIMQKMADSDFTEKTGIKVDLSIVPDQTKLILANASGKAPDIALSIASGNVYDLAIRGALQDMREFDTFKEVGRRFAPGMLIPGVCDEGLYAIPETFNFWVLYYRKDILDSLGLSVPTTMQEVRDMLPQLRRMGMDFNSHVSNFVAKPFLATSPFVFQAGGNIYNEETGMSAIDSKESLEGLTILTENYSVYNMRFDIQSFYQYFRDGRTPIGVSDYGTFNLLTNAAPELAGNWGVALYPGIEDENGDVQRWTSGAAESNVIFSSSQMKEEAWKFIDWWMSTEAQTEFSFTLQTTLGNEYLWNSANLDAMMNAPWNRKQKEIIVEQLQWTYETPRIPGGYMAERELSNVVNSVVSDGRKLQSAVDEAHKRINREVKRKLEEFGYTKDGVFVKELVLPDVDTIKGWLE